MQQSPAYIPFGQDNKNSSSVAYYETVQASAN